MLKGGAATIRRAPAAPSPTSDDPIRRAIARRMRECRRRAGMTIAEAARRIGVTDRTVERSESGAHVPRADIYVRAMQLYGVDAGIDLLA